LFNEFETIFADIFERRAEDYKEIVQTLINGAQATSTICDKLGMKQTGAFSKMLNGLLLSGFIQRDYVWSGNTRKKLSKYRLSDNYLRFYLKFIEPQKHLIEQDIYNELHVENLPGWASYMGFQFENLVLNNVALIIKKLDIPVATVLNASPYFQRKTQRVEAC